MGGITRRQIPPRPGLDRGLDIPSPSASSPWRGCLAGWDCGPRAGASLLAQAAPARLAVEDGARPCMRENGRGHPSIEREMAIVVEKLACPNPARCGGIEDGGSKPCVRVPVGGSREDEKGPQG
ncbi:hypothetical protein DCS_08269 [Drechmeria coniospora]|uniref:Uncharacterized protein n=1 Tax=Drechmeria coniospora TaxID=98403 RepID=A0A151GGS6_DRECN|nr:hypothetical protein DCS_08269 [Drechmeria coniospora]KYK56299.1 hypothetical protein DCS_08269 [Drechmeria coniospora]